MRIAHVIFAFKDPELIKRQILAMEHKDFDFYVHLDRKSDMKLFQDLVELPNTRFVSDRALMHWGGFSFIRALLFALEDIFESGIEYDFVNLLTGQDYPIKTVDHIHDFFSNNIGKSFITYETPPSLWWSQSMRRFRQYHMTDYSFKGRTRIEQLLTAVLPPRKFPLPFKLYGGPCSSYWTISIESARYLFEFLQRNLNLKLRIFFKHTWAPDEFLISTIILNSPFKDNVVNNNQRYIDWTMGGARPKIIVAGDFQKLERSGRLYARKFDIRIDTAILDMIDTQLLLRDPIGREGQFTATASSGSKTGS